MGRALALFLCGVALIALAVLASVAKYSLIAMAWG